VSIKFGSVCSGIESASVAFEPLGMQAAWFSEIEAFPSAVLAHHWPDTDNHGDMTKLPSMILRGDIEAPEILIGGTPCQAFSVAGNRESMNDERGQLTLSYVEIANAIDHVRIQQGKPECVTVWENVPGVLSTKDNAFGCFLAALVGESEALEPAGEKWTNAGCVYGPERSAAWRILDAQYFGVAQRRRRVFVVASAREGFDPCAVLFESEAPADDVEGVVSSARGLPILTCRTAGNSNARGVVLNDGGNYRALTPEEEEQRQGFPAGHTRVAEGCPDGPRYKAIGNSKAVPVVRWIGKRLLRELGE
jgi:DNA (cytosine-5)-methyltransferase 1